MQTQEILAVILGGGKGTRLYPLTKYRAKPAVPFGGKFRIIDVSISNCLNSGINKIHILTQFNTHSLHRHIYGTYRLGHFSDGFVDILVAEQTMENTDWYQGTADAVRKNLSYITEINTEYTIILSGDHLYRMDYREFLATHIAHQADITIATKPVSGHEAPDLGILQTDQKGRVVRFVEKPRADQLDGLRSPGLASDTPFLASMGIYIFTTATMLKILESNASDDFGRHIIPGAIADFKVCTHKFEGFWKDIGTIESFFKTNLELASAHPPFRMDDEKAPLYTRPRRLPGSRCMDCRLGATLLADGCYLEKSRIERAVVGIRTIIRRDTRIEECIIMGADYYESEPPLGLPPVGIGSNCIIRKAIIDKNARIGNAVRIVNQRNLLEFDCDNYTIRDGIVVIPKNAVIPDGTII